jgi:hypothetical protein
MTIFFDNSLIIRSVLHEIKGKFLMFRHMWNKTISFYIFFKDIWKIRSKRSHKAKRQTLCENPTLNAIQSLLRSKN